LSDTGIVYAFKRILLNANTNKQLSLAIIVCSVHAALEVLLFYVGRTNAKDQLRTCGDNVL